MSSSTGHSYDTHLGGETAVMSNFTLKQFAAPRIEEILMLSEAINEPPAKGQLFQRLPKHMRRRQMSHHQNRLPRKLRLNIEPKINDPPSKRPSRKFRRKPKNLLVEYNRRKIGKIWLETHIWHAKRFHMTEKWGYKLAESSTNKGFRANYRAIKSHCLLLDISYMVCIELAGKEEILLEGLKQCTDPACGLSFAGRAYTSGTKEGQVAVFHPKAFPYKIIGNVSFLWKPKTKECNRTLWIWAHPAFYQELTNCFVDLFKLTKNFTTAEDRLLVPKWTSEYISLAVLKDKLNRFRLIGPLSSCVLWDSLTVAQLPENKEPLSERADVPVQQERMDIDPTNTNSSSDVLGNIYGEEYWRESWAKQKEMFLKFAHTAATQFPSGCVYGLPVFDPRFILPQQRTKSNFSTSGDYIPCWSDLLAVSVLWDESARESVSSMKPSDWQVNKIRERHVVPQMQSTGSVVPILLIQQPGSYSQNGFGAGWDVIIPSDWGMPFWRGFVLRGARTGGLRELSLLRLESSSLASAIQPDSTAGYAAAQQTQFELQTKHFKRPPAKRPNFIKLGMFEPFSTPWSMLCNGNFYVLRDVSLIKKLYEAVEKRKFIPIRTEAQALVPVCIRCAEGRPEALARLCLPLREDFKAVNLEEPVHADENYPKRVEIRRKNQELLRQWKKDRNRKKKGKETIWDANIEKQLRVDSKALMEKHWLPEKDNETSRKVVGYITQGDFVHREGIGMGLGYVTLEALLMILNLAVEEKKPPVLVMRNVHHYHYHQATFQIVCD